METSQSQESTKLVTKKRMRDSRLMTFAMIIIFILAFLYLFSTVAIFCLTRLTIKEKSADEVTQLTEAVANYIHIDVAGAIGTIATAVCARYLARETANNITGKGGYITTQTAEEEKSE